MPGGGGNPGGIHDALGNGLVHGHAAAQIAAAGIGHAQQVQGGLNASVLAAGAVQGQEHQVRHGAHGQHILAQQGRPLVPAAAAHGLQIRLRGQDPVIAAQAVRRVKDIGETAGIVLQAQEHIHQNGLVAPLAQGAAHAGAAGQRYLPLGAQTAGQNNDFHRDPSFLKGTMPQITHYINIAVYHTGEANTTVSCKSPGEKRGTAHPGPGYFNFFMDK